MKIIGLFFIVALLMSGCDSSDTDPRPKSRTTTQYSRTMDDARESADQLEKSLSTSAQRAEEAKQ